MNILVTGGAGYIGCHLVKRLLEKSSHNLIVIDNLTTGHREMVPGGVFIAGDCGDSTLIKKIMQKHAVEAVIHLAADSIVGESKEKPAKYFNNNIAMGLNLLNSMLECQVKIIIFSSSTAVYGEPEKLPIDENHPLKPSNIYGVTKSMFEQVLDYYSMVYGLKYISLRYFNAAGANPGGSIGECHNPETHLIPIALQAVLGQRQKVLVFGNDYPTPDGTCIRDYIHVTDLADAHILALEAIMQGKPCNVYNLGNERGYSVIEVLKLCGEVANRNVPFEYGLRRPGDPAILMATSEKIRQDLGWHPRYTDLKDIIVTAWKWHSRNLG